jgi:hypothetical protein
LTSSSSSGEGARTAKLLKVELPFRDLLVGRTES